MGCGASHSVPASAAVGVYVSDKPKTPQTTKELTRTGVQRESSDSLKSFSDSALNVKLSSDKNLVLVWDGELPSKTAYYEQALMVLKIKGLEFTEEVVSVANPPAWYKVCGQQLWSSIACRVAIKFCYSCCRRCRNHRCHSLCGVIDLQRK